MATFLRTFCDDGIFGPACWGWDSFAPFQSIFPLLSSYAAFSFLKTKDTNPFISLWNIFLESGSGLIRYSQSALFLLVSVFSVCSAELFFSETHFIGHNFAVWTSSEGCNISGLCPAGVSRGGVWADPGLDRQRQHHHHRYQCLGSAWSACIWASRIRIHYSEVRGSGSESFPFLIDVVPRRLFVTALQ